MHVVFCKRMQQWFRGGSISTIDRFLDVLVKEGLSAKLSVSVTNHTQSFEEGKEEECALGKRGLCGACDVLKMLTMLTDSSSRLSKQGTQVESNHMLECSLAQISQMVFFRFLVSPGGFVGKCVRLYKGSIHGAN